MSWLCLSPSFHFSCPVDVQVCIHDKRRELEKAMVKDPIKCALMLETCLGSGFFETEIPLTRIEFRLRRSILKDMGVNSVQDLLEKETSITKRLTERRFRIITVPKLSAGLFDFRFVIIRPFRELHEAVI